MPCLRHTHLLEAQNSVVHRWSIREDSWGYFHWVLFVMGSHYLS